MYINKTKYSNKNNSFILQLTIFFDICTRIDISQEILLKAFFTILTGLVLNYYYSNTSRSIAVTFDKVCESIPIYFEEAKYKRSIL